MINNKKMTPQELAETYYDQYGSLAYEKIQHQIQKMNAQFDMMGYTSEELAEHKALKQALLILQDYE
jgi:hypothetical protein